MALCTQTDVEQRLQVDFGNPTDPVVASLIAAAQGHVEREYGGPIETATYTAERHTGLYRTVLFLLHHPVTSVTTIVENGVTLAATDYSWTPDGTIRRVTAAGGLGWWKGDLGDITVTYVAGYATNDLPDDLRDVCAWMVAGALRRGMAFGNNEAALFAGTASEQLGEYLISYNEANSDPAALILMTEEQRQIVRSYRLGDFRKVGFGVA